MTSDYLSRMKIPHRLVIEEQEYKKYKSYTKDNQYASLLVLDRKFQAKYETLDDLGETKSKGPGAARNFAWQHSIDRGDERHWVMDDNIRRFVRFNKNIFYSCYSGSFFRAMEDFCLRYENIYMAGPRYFMFVKRKAPEAAVLFNSRIYSCNLIKNDIPYKWRGRYNEDTILSLDILRGGFCTIQFNAFLQEKITTQIMRGGCSGEFYDREGTLPKSRLLAQVYPQYAKIVYKFSRIHHYVDYSSFKKNRLIRRKDIDWASLEAGGCDNYGMKLSVVED